MKILNIVTDQIFINDLVSVCEYTKGHHIHDYIVITSQKITKSFRFIKSDLVHYVDITEIQSYIGKENFNVVVIHGLQQLYLKFMLALSSKVKLVWFAWGYDIYTYPHINNPFVKVNLYHDSTKKVLFKDFKSKLHFLNGYIYSKLNSNKIHKAISRVDYFSGVLPEEYILMSHNPFFKAKKMRFNYFSLNSPYKENMELTFNTLRGHDIMVGNSGDPTNNHIDIFKILYELKVFDVNIYVPLSYGGTPSYVHDVIECGKRLFGDKFKPLLNFMPYEEYCKILDSCTNVIMGHERQQAMGNIEMSLWAGKKVFLYNTSIPFLHLKKCGYKIYSIQEDLNKNIISDYMSLDDIVNNRKIILSYATTESRLKQICDCYKMLESDLK